MKITLMGLLGLMLTSILSHLQAAPVKGYADLHNHMLAEYSMGGAWFHGSHAGHEMEAMGSCSGNADFLFRPKDHARTVIPGLNELIGKVPGSDGDTGWHVMKGGGFPDYSGWPRWDTIAHQQVWEGFLKDAHNDGLSLLVVSAVNFQPLCQLLPEEGRTYSCNDMDAVDLQIDALHKFDKERDWVELALSPEHARKIILSGKLALVLAIEVSDLFEGMDWKKALDHYYDRGVRSLQVVHELNNRFGGAAIHAEIFQMFQFFRSLKDFDLNKLGFQIDSEGKNKLGLTNEGRQLIKAMIKKNMLLDLAHLSERGIKDTKEILDHVAPGYPFYISHGHFKDMMAQKSGNFEKSSPQWILDLLKEHNGMFGLRTGAEATKSFGKVPNDCDGSSKSFAQSYQFGKSKGVKLAFGSDLNGFIQQMRPRFGNEKETCGAYGDKKKREAQQKLQHNQLGKAFDHSGFGHVGQMNDILAELKNFGLDTSDLENSAEAYLQMWQRTYSPTPAPIRKIYRDLAGE